MIASRLSALLLLVLWLPVTKVDDAVLEGAVFRLRPGLITDSVAAPGLIPMLGSEIQKPRDWVVALLAEALAKKFGLLWCDVRPLVLGVGVKEGSGATPPPRRFMFSRWNASKTEFGCVEPVAMRHGTTVT